MKKPFRRQTHAVADLVAELLDPVLSRKTGMTTGLISAWPEIVGSRLEHITRPDKLMWPPQRFPDDPFEPATLVIACEGTASLRLQHQTSEILSRVNAYFGYAAVAKIKIVQKPVVVKRTDHKPRLRPISAREREQISESVEHVEHPRLKAALDALGQSLVQRKHDTDR